MVIGIDCAVQSKHVGLALGSFDGAKTILYEVHSGDMVGSVVETIGNWVLSGRKALIALDAPLGWPEQLGSTLVNHAAGAGITELPNFLFRRETDRFIKEKIGKLPLDVGADRIARTAHAALSLLESIRLFVGEAVPLAWDPGYSAPCGVIEVYPAGTLAAYSQIATGYKGPDGQPMRLNIVDWLTSHMECAADRTLMAENPDVLDAVLWVLAGVDFLKGDVYFPENGAAAVKEGWIWVRKK